MPTLIILRGPSAAGKSTVARALQNLSTRDTVLLEQDMFNNEIFKGITERYDWVPRMIEDAAKRALDVGYDVIIEGIFRREKYASMFERIAESNPGRTFIYYFDISQEETKKRHATRDKSALFGNDEMLSWYSAARPIGHPEEIIIKESLSEKEIIDLIASQVGLR